MTSPDSGRLAELPVEENAGGAIQLRNTYIVTTTRDGLMVIDQHRAHLRVLYDSYLAKTGEQDFVAQSTMFPDIVELSASQNAVLSDIAPQLGELGFILTNRGDNVWSIDGIPSAVKDIDRVTEPGEELASTLRERVALSLAKGSAIGRGRPLTQNEIDRLVSDLLRLPSPGLTPEGKNVFTIIPFDQISRLLG